MFIARGIAVSRWMRLYGRTVGGIQMLYAAYFGSVAFDYLRWSIQQMIWIAQKGFNFQGSTFKGLYIPAFNVHNFLEGTVFALLSLCCLIGGCGLLLRRSWAWRWEIIYVIGVTVYSLRILANAVSRGYDFEPIGLCWMALVLPYVPVLVTAPPVEKVVESGKLKGGRRALDDLGDT